MDELKSKHFANGSVYLLKCEDGALIETTDTFLPFYTKDAIGRKQNDLCSSDLGTRAERWMVGVSTMSGCPVSCKFCATGTMKRSRNLSAEEIVQQVNFILQKNNCQARDSQEFKINYTRMGEPFLNSKAVRAAIEEISSYLPNAHHYVSTIGIQGADYSWIKGNITLQVSLHSLDDERRNWLIPFKRKITVEELGKIRTKSDLKTTVNMTLVDEEDFDITELTRLFDKDHFFIKLSPINENCVSRQNGTGRGIIQQKNLK